MSTNSSTNNNNTNNITTASVAAAAVAATERHNYKARPPPLPLRASLPGTRALLGAGTLNSLPQLMDEAGIDAVVVVAPAAQHGRRTAAHVSSLLGKIRCVATIETGARALVPHRAAIEQVLPQARHALSGARNPAIVACGGGAALGVGKAVAVRLAEEASGCSDRSPWAAAAAAAVYDAGKRHAAPTFVAVPTTYSAGETSLRFGYSVLMREMPPCAAAVSSTTTSASSDTNPSATTAPTTTTTFSGYSSSSSSSSSSSNSSSSQVVRAENIWRHPAAQPSIIIYDPLANAELPGAAHAASVTATLSQGVNVLVRGTGGAGTLAQSTEGVRMLSTQLRLFAKRGGRADAQMRSAFFEGAHLCGVARERQEQEEKEAAATTIPADTASFALMATSASKKNKKAVKSKVKRGGGGGGGGGEGGRVAAQNVHVSYDPSKDTSQRQQQNLTPPPSPLLEKEFIDEPKLIDATDAKAASAAAAADALYSDNAALILVGAFHLSWANVRSALLPYALEHIHTNAPHAARALAEVMGVGRSANVAAMQWEIQRNAGAPTNLRAAGLRIEDLSRVTALLAAEARLDASAVAILERMVAACFHGRCPAVATKNTTLLKLQRHQDIIESVGSETEVAPSQGENAQEPLVHVDEI